MYTIVGLGNPGKEYRETRHNTGRIAIDFLAKKHDIELVSNKKYSGNYGKGNIAHESVQLLQPDTFMNKSGKSVAEAVKSKKGIEQMIVIYDDLDLPFGTMKMSYNRSSGGHRGLESIIRALKSESFVRIRVGVSASTLGGKIKKPKGEEKVLKFIMGKFNTSEKETLKKLFKKIDESIETWVTRGRETAMSQIN